MVRPDGTDLTRLTDLGSDPPNADWSPDGKWLLFGNDYGIYVVDVAARRAARVSGELALGGAAWAR